MTAVTSENRKKLLGLVETKGIECAYGAQALPQQGAASPATFGGPRLVGLGNCEFSNSRPIPDLRNFSLPRAERWSANVSVWMSSNSPRIWPALEEPL